MPSQRAKEGFEAGEPLLQRAGAIERAQIGEVQKGRTDKFYVEIEKIVEEIEKGSKGGLRTQKGIQDVVDAIQQGKLVDKALEHTNFNFYLFTRRI